MVAPADASQQRRCCILGLCSQLGAMRRPFTGCLAYQGAPARLQHERETKLLSGRCSRCSVANWAKVRQRYAVALEVLFLKKLVLSQKQRMLFKHPPCPPRTVPGAPMGHLTRQGMTTEAHYGCHPLTRQGEARAAAHLDRAQRPRRRLDVASHFVGDLRMFVQAPDPTDVTEALGATTVFVGVCDCANATDGTCCMASASMCSISTVSTSTSCAKARTATASLKLPTTCRGTRLSGDVHKG